MATMAEKRDYYEVLGVSRTASVEEIAQAYRKAALKYHPDRNPGDQEAVAAFKEAAEAFEVLNHADKRQIYDRYGHQGLERGGASPQFHDVSDIFDAFGDLFGDSLFGDLFGGRRQGRGRRVHKGENLQVQVELDLIEAARGVSKTITFRRHARCETCEGSGAKRGSRVESCEYCGGHGRVVQQTGIFAMQSTCPACRGSGKVIRQPCGDCRGSGYSEVEVTREVKIPAGVDDDMQVRLTGEGEPSPDGGPPGDCYCLIRIHEHPLFARNGQTLVCQVPISYSQAALGASIEVPTLDGPEDLDVPAGTQSGDVFSLAGRGMPDPRRRGRGDLKVQVFIDVPRELSAEHEDLLRRLAEVEKSQVSPKRSSFFERLKSYFQHSD